MINFVFKMMVFALKLHKVEPEPTPPYLAQLQVTQAFFEHLDAMGGAAEEPAAQRKRRTGFYWGNAMEAYRCVPAMVPPEPEPEPTGGEEEEEAAA